MSDNASRGSRIGVSLSLALLLLAAGACGQFRPYGLAGGKKKKQDSQQHKGSDDKAAARKTDATTKKPCCPTKPGTACPVDTSNEPPAKQQSSSDKSTKGFQPSGTKKPEPKQAAEGDRSVASPPSPWPTSSFVPPEYLCDEVGTEFTGEQVAMWQTSRAGEERCVVSPLLQVGPGEELNHHRVTVTFSGSGSVRASIAHSTSSDLNKTLANTSAYRPLRKTSSGAELLITTPYKGERYAWLLLQADGDVRISHVRHTCWRGKDTLYGHVGAYYRFGGSKLPYRLMYPRDYDPSRAYPLVLTVPSSGGIGSNNVKNMEMVGLAGYLFKRYYFDDELACFSVVPELPPHANIPAPYFPQGPLGKPHPLYHPGNFHVNEKGWYTQASLALIEDLMGCGDINIDPNRVYFSGFSYGGKGCWEFLKAVPERFAAAMCAGGWAIGKPYAEPRGMLLQELAKEVDRYKHVPIWIFAGEKDGMSLSSRAVHKELLNQGADAQYTEFPATDHVSSAVKTWGGHEHIAWLFRQKR